MNAKDKQGPDLAYFNFEPFMQHFVSTMALTNPEIPYQKFNDFYLTLLKKLNFAENLRLQILTEILYSGKTQSEHTITSIFEAIFNKDSHFLKILLKSKKNYCPHFFCRQLMNSLCF